MNLGLFVLFLLYEAILAKIIWGSCSRLVVPLLKTYPKNTKPRERMVNKGFSFFLSFSWALELSHGRLLFSMVLCSKLCSFKRKRGGRKVKSVFVPLHIDSPKILCGHHGSKQSDPK